MILVCWCTPIICSPDYDPLLVVTRIDDVEEAGENERLRKEIISRVPMKEADIFFHKNYVTETERDIKVDLSTRRILKAIIQRYEDRFKSKGVDYWSKIQWDLTSVMASWSQLITPAAAYHILKERKASLHLTSRKIQKEEENNKKGEGIKERNDETVDIEARIDGEEPRISATPIHGVYGALLNKVEKRYSVSARTQQLVCERKEVNLDSKLKPNSAVTQVKPRPAIYLEKKGFNSHHRRQRM